jgi:hypothetical protein
MDVVVSHAARGDAPVLPETRVTLAFGNDTFPVLVRKLQSEDPVVLRAALTAAGRLLPTSMNCVKAVCGAVVWRADVRVRVRVGGYRCASVCVRVCLCCRVRACRARGRAFRGAQPVVDIGVVLPLSPAQVSAGAVEELTRLCGHDDVDVRRGASADLGLLLVNPTAKACFVCSSMLPRFRAAIANADVQTRLQSLAALDTLCESAPYPDQLVAEGYVSQLVDQARDDTDAAATAAALRVLARCVNVGGPGPREAVRDGAALPVCIGLLRHGDAAVREQAARVLALLCFVDDAKPAAVRDGAPEALLALLGDEHSGVRCHAVSAAMTIAVDNDGKEAFLRAGLEPLVALLSDASEFTRINAMRTVATLSANPAARARFRELSVELPLTDAAESERRSAAERDVAAKTLSVVRWRA